MRERLNTEQIGKEMKSLRDRVFTYILLILTLIGGAGLVLFSPDFAEANFSASTDGDVCLKCHSIAHTGATINAAVDGVETTSASIDNDGTDSFELDWMFEGSSWTSSKESVGVLIAIPTGWSLSNGTVNSPALTNWSSQWDNVDGGQSWTWLSDPNGDCPAGHECYSIEFSAPWDHDTADENLACNMGGTTCDGGSGGTDQDGVRDRMGTDVVIKTSPGAGTGSKTIYVYGIGYDDNTKAYKSQTINVTVNDSGTVSGKSPATVVDDNSNGGTVAWSNPGYASAQDTAYADAQNMDTETSDYLKATNFGFSIPAGATIYGIVVEVDRYAQNPNAVNDAEVKIVKNGVIGSQNKAAGGFWPIADSNTYATYGGSSDLWNETWTAADINSANFGVVLSVSENGAKGDVFVDHIRIIVYYTDSAPSLTIDEPAGGDDSVAQGQSFNIQYDLSDADDVATVDFYYETDGNGLGGSAIAACQDQAEGTNQLCAWNTTGLPVNSYYVYGVADDGVNTPVTVVSSGTLDITNSAPSLTIDEPAGGNDSVEQGQSFNIQYDLSDIEDVAIVDFYYETDGNGSGGTAIGSCLAQAEGTDQLCAWDTSGIPVDTYYIYGVADDGVNSIVTVVSSGTLDITSPVGANFTIDSCTDCHATPPATGSLRNNPEGAVVGTHNVFEHDVNNCGNCHVEPGAAEYDHRNGNIELNSTIHGQTGSSYSKGTSFAQTNSPTLGTCSATYCHGGTSFTWGSEKTSLDYCTLCHGKETIGADKTATDANTYLRAPGADGTGVDTGGDTENTDVEVGAHQAHLIAASSISSAIACEECHNVPNAPTVAGHWDTSGARDAADLAFNGPIGVTDGNDVALSITYSSGQCSNTYCHDGRNFKNGWSTAAQIDSDFETPTWNEPIISGNEITYGGDGNICNNCHGYPPAGSHDASSDCSNCHGHVDATDDGFTGGTNIALHINHVVEAQGECIICHNGVPGGATYVTRDVVGGDFTLSSRHVFGGTVTNWDCIVCHREGDATAASSGSVGTTSLHNNSGGIVVDLRNVDSINTGWTWDKYDGSCSNPSYDNINDCTENSATWSWNNSPDDQMHTDMDTFCMSCHDSDGASGINVKAADDGVHLDNTRALTPFNSTDGVSAGTGGATKWMAGYNRTAVIDVYTQFDPTNPSHHAVRGQAYTSHNANWGNTAWINRQLKNSTYLVDAPGGAADDGEYESAQLHCADCHTVDQNSHGGSNGFMLSASSIDDTCYLCHNSTTYSDNSSSDTRWDHSNDGGVWDASKGSKLGQYGANAGSICLNCHGGNPVTDGFGGIHGLPYNAFNCENDPGYPNTGNADCDSRSGEPRYRFMGGSYMSHTPGSWTGTGGSATCYFDSTTDTQPWSSCTAHGGPGKETETGRTASPQYSRGVPGDY